MVIGRFSTVVLLLHLVFSLAWSVSVDICACRYRFVEQPSNAIMCNPYPTNRFITRCIVDFSTNEGVPLSLSWYSRANSGSTPQRLSGGFTTFNGIRTVESTLTVALPAATPSIYEGYRYFCRVRFFNGTILKDSQEFYLFPQSVVTGVLDYPTCDEQSAQSTQFEECIDPNYPTLPPPTTTTLAAPETTSSPVDTTAPPTTTTQTTDAPTTPLPTTPPPTTSSPTTPPPTMPPPTTPEPMKPKTIPPSSAPPPTTSTPEDTVGVSDNALTFDEEVLIYSAIAAAAVLVVVVVILLLCLCMWNRVCRQSKYCMCNSYY